MTEPAERSWHVEGGVVRPYRPTDREAIRWICCETADRGDPIEPLFPYRAVAADLLTRYYTDEEPEATWVAESEGRIVGYLTGALQSRRYERLMRWPIIPRAVCAAILHGALGSRQTWRLARAAVRT